MSENSRKNSSSKKLDELILVDCVSYTVVSLILAFLSFFDLVMGLNPRVLFQLFAVTTLICFLMYLTSFLPIESPWAEMLVSLADVGVVVLGVGGGIFRWFPWQAKYIWMVSGVFVIVYFITYGIILLQNKIASDQINRILQEKRREQK
ncbi:DUF3021 family protein [Pygmaiobacter massiliensis]|uniref:DUF3021 family protein n=1 Tax=Pygmaiobacter massiliensis TaxID=1917873 RepID=UPI000C7B979A|nr:DUF3021 family protein [Pygmaiobacter massiliensis]